MANMRLNDPAICAKELGMLNNFSSLAGQLIHGLHNTFPDDPKIKEQVDRYETIVKESQFWKDKLIRAYHGQMGPYYDCCKSKNFEPFLEGKVPFLDDLNFKQHYEEMTDPSQPPDQVEENIGNILEVILQMNQYAQLYNRIPPKLGSKIEEMATKIALDVTSGKTTFGACNLFNLGAEVVKGATSDDIKRMIEGMPAILDAVGGIEGAQERMGIDLNIPTIPNMDALINVMSKQSDKVAQTVMNDMNKEEAPGQKGADQKEGAGAGKARGWRPK